MSDSHVPKLLNAFSPMLSYPDNHLAQTAELAYVVLQDELPDAAGDMAAFGAFVEQHDAWQVEEAFTRTFDVNPACALEVGWHLFGEEYARGTFLVRMRTELRRFELPESVELPDHISHVLAIVAAMPDDEAEKFVTACVCPAAETMSRALDDNESPYRLVVQCLAKVLRHRWGGSPTVEEPQAFRAQGIDPLRAFPVADVGCGGGCGASPGDLIQIATHNDQEGVLEIPPVSEDERLNGRQGDSR